MEENFKIQGDRQGFPAYFPPHCQLSVVPSAIASYCFPFKRKGKTLSINIVSSESAQCLAQRENLEKIFWINKWMNEWKSEGIKSLSRQEGLGWRTLVGIDLEQDYAPPSMERRKGWKADLNNLSHGREKGTDIRWPWEWRERDDSQGCQATVQLQHINLKSNQLSSFRNFPVDRVKEIGTEEGVIASSARNWGPAWLSSEAGPGPQSGASHTTEVTNHVTRTGEESETRKGR